MAVLNKPMAKLRMVHLVYVSNATEYKTMAVLNKATAKLRMVHHLQLYSSGEYSI